MRLRHIKGAEEEIAESPYVIQEPKSQRGRWHTLFENENPIHIEIGMGKGKFLMELAAKNPLVNYVGIERYASVLLKGLRKRQEAELPNVWFMRVDARELADIFDEGEVDRIYLNFSDPWPKDRHAKRRLTSDRFLAVYDRILKKSGVVEFKTDNKELFRFSLESSDACGWRTREKTFDLHHSAAAVGNIMTEYETRFAAEGKPICRLVAFRGE